MNDRKSFLESQYEHRLQQLERLQEGNVAYYSGYSPFVGAGVRLGGWSFVCNTAKKGSGKSEHTAIAVSDLYRHIHNSEEVSIWGKDLFVYLDNLYENRAAFCVMFISEIYLKKAWCNHERNSAMRRQDETSEYILPVCLDQTPLPGITDKYSCLDARDYSPIQLAEAIRMKLWTKLK